MEVAGQQSMGRLAANVRGQQVSAYETRDPGSGESSHHPDGLEARYEVLNGATDQPSTGTWSGSLVRSVMHSLSCSKAAANNSATLSGKRRRCAFTLAARA